MIANNILNQIRTLLIKIKNNEGLSSIAPIHYCTGGPNSNKENRKKKMWELKGINHTLIIHKWLFTYRRIHRQNIRNTKGWVKRLDARSMYRYQLHFYPPAKTPSLKAPQNWGGWKQTNMSHVPKSIQQMSKIYLQKSIKLSQKTFVKTNIWILT